MHTLLFRHFLKANLILLFVVVVVVGGVDATICFCFHWNDRFVTFFCFFVLNPWRFLSSTFLLFCLESVARFLPSILSLYYLSPA